MLSPEVDMVMKGCGCVFPRRVLDISFSNLDSILVLRRRKQQLLTFANVPLCLHAYLCHYFWHQLFSFIDTVRPNNHQTDAFSSGMSLN